MEDTEQVKALCEKYKINMPTEGKIIVVEENGIIKSFVCMKYVMMISPFVSESPVYSKWLYNFLEERIKENNIPIVECFIEKHNEGLLNKLGFQRIFPDHLIMEKVF